MKWPLTFYTNFCLKDWQAAVTIGPVILIREKYRNDEGLYAHERKHVSQWLRSLGTMAFLYPCIPMSRAVYEAQAYAEQTKHPDGKGGCMGIATGAARMVAHYNLGLTQLQCQKMIEEQLK